jgi:hypothetical protein
LSEQQKKELHPFLEKGQFQKKGKTLLYDMTWDTSPVVKTFLGKTEPAAIVKVRNEEQL